MSIGRVNISRRSDLALRTLMQLAVGQRYGDRMTAAAIASAINASPGHVGKIVARLVELETVVVRRGRGGGLQITDKGRRMPVGELLRELEGDAELVECDGPRPCPLASNCQLRRALARARYAFFETLDDLTVQDAARPPAERVHLPLPPLDA